MAIAQEVQESVDTWISWLSETGRKEKTVQTYRYYLKTMLNLLQDGGRPITPQDIDADAIYWIRDACPLQEYSTKMMVNALGLWVEWTTGRNPVRQAKILWNSEDHPNRVFITKEEFDRLDRVAGPCEHVILMLGGCMGLRRGEMAAIKMSDITSEGIHITGKGHGLGKMAVMGVPQVVKKALMEWIPIRTEILRKRGTTCDYLLISDRTGRELKAEGIQYRVEKLERLTGVRVTPHSLRRLFATTLYEAHVDLTDIVRLMRHQDPATTMKHYIRTNTLRLNSILDSVMAN